MGIEHFYVTPMTVIRPGTTTDRYNDDALDWGTPSTHVVNVWLHDLSSFETLGNRDTTSVSAQIFCDPLSDLLAGDRVEIDGVTYEVDGAPQMLRTPIGDHHIEANLRIFDDARGAV